MFKWSAISLSGALALLLSTTLHGVGQETRLAAAPPSETQAVSSSQSGKPSGEVSALEVAAELGVIDAQQKLARMYAEGDGVKQNEVKAFDLYRRIVDDNADVRPHHEKSSSVAEAFVALANYYRTGIAGTRNVADKRRAARLLWHAASYLGDAEAQCQLAQMYLSGEGVRRNPRLAINWLANAARKRHAKSQALLGDLLWRGGKDVRRQPLKGLAFLALARQNAGGSAQAQWIGELHQLAYAESDNTQRLQAAELTTRWQDAMGNANFVARSTGSDETRHSSAAPGAAETTQETKPSAGFTNIGMEGAGALR